jgi:hypothetical protein
MQERCLDSRNINFMLGIPDEMLGRIDVLKVTTKM